MVARLNYTWKWSIYYCSLSAMFYPLHSSTNQELFEKHICNHSSHYEKFDGAVRPVIVWKWSIHYPSLSAMFDSLLSSTNQELFENNVSKLSSHYKNYDVAACPSYRLKLKYSLSAMFDSIHSSMNQEVFEKHLCNKNCHYEKYGLFLVTQRKPSRATTKLMLFIVSKDNGTQRRTLVSPWRIHCMYCGVPKGTSWGEATSNSEKIKSIALAVIELR